MSLNKAMIIGNLGRDPEMRYTQGGQAVTQFTVAVNRNYKGRERRVEGRNRVVPVWPGPRSPRGPPSTFARPQGLRRRPTPDRTWDGQDGQKHYTTELVANTVTPLDPRPREDGAAEPAGARPAKSAAPSGRAVVTSSARATSTSCLSRAARRFHDSNRRALNAAVTNKGQDNMPTNPREKTRGKRDDYYRDRRRRKVCTSVRTRRS